MKDFPPSSRSAWQLPDGVSPGTWDYVRTRSIATQYSDFIDHTPLTKLDWQIVSHWLPPISPGVQRPTVIEFGCGNGRVLLPLTGRGYRCIGVDLSIAMLQEMQKRYQNALANSSHSSGPTLHERGPLISIQANLVQLDAVVSNSVDHAVCLFSTLGMIRGQRYRRQFLDHARRIIKPGGRFILHAHNLWNQLPQRGGWTWFAKHLLEVASKKMELGDRFSDYRGIRNMFIHSFRKRELIDLLTRSGFSVQEIYPVTSALLDRIESSGHDQTALGITAEDIRTSTSGTFSTIGWIVVCQ